MQTELQLEDNVITKSNLPMTFEDFEEISQLIKDDITNKNTNIRELIS